MYDYKAELAALEQILEPFLRDGFCFVNIGANDGIANDPIYPFAMRHRWRGLAVEPVPYLYERLARNYADLPDVIVDQVAVSPGGHHDRQSFYYLDPGNESHGHITAQIGSLSRKRVEQTVAELRERTDVLPSRASLPPGVVGDDVPLASEGGSVEIPVGLEDQLRTVDVESVPFDDLMVRHGIDRIDLLNIDAEGFDFEIFQSIDLERYCPQVLCIECWDFGPERRHQLDTALAEHGLVERMPFALFSRVFSR